jgi:hypothetical protein
VSKSAFTRSNGYLVSFGSTPTTQCNPKTSRGPTGKQPELRRTVVDRGGKLGQTAHRSVCRRRNPRLRRQRRKTSVLTEKPVKHSKLSQFTLFRLRKVSFLSKNQLVADGNSVSRDTGAYATRSALAVALRRFKSASSARQAAGTLQPRALSRYKPT